MSLAVTSEHTFRADREPLFRRFWILSLFSGVEEAGCSPIDLKRFNVLAYLSNAVAQCYGVPPLDATVLKERDGPLYPILIWDIDRLVGMGLVHVTNIVIDNQNRVRNVSYAITADGIKYEERCRKAIPGLEHTGNSLRSVAMAYSRNHLKLSEDSLLARDGNYANSSIANGQVVDFGDWELNNATANSVNRILEVLGATLQKDPTLGVNLYSRYLAAFASNGGDHE